MNWVRLRTLLRRSGLEEFENGVIDFFNIIAFWFMCFFFTWVLEEREEYWGGLSGTRGGGAE